MKESHRNRNELQNKLALNKQRIFAKKVIRELDVPFDSSAIVYGAVREEALNSLYQNCRVLNPVYYPSETELEILLGDRIYKEFGFKQKLLDCLNRIKPDKNEDKAYLWFNNEESPLFKVQISHVMHSLQEIALYSGYDFVLSSLDFSSGIAVSHSGGYVADDYSPEEVIYEFEGWGMFVNDLFEGKKALDE